MSVRFVYLCAYLEFIFPLLPRTCVSFVLCNGEIIFRAFFLAPEKIIGEIDKKNTNEHRINQMYTCHTRLINCSNRVRLLDKSHSNKAVL